MNPFVHAENKGYLWPRCRRILRGWCFWGLRGRRRQGSRRGRWAARQASGGVLHCERWAKHTKADDENVAVGVLGAVGIVAIRRAHDKETIWLIIAFYYFLLHYDVVSRKVYKVELVCRHLSHSPLRFSTASLSLRPWLIFQLTRSRRSCPIYSLIGQWWCQH